VVAQCGCDLRRVSARRDHCVPGGQGGIGDIDA